MPEVGKGPASQLGDDVAADGVAETAAEQVARGTAAARVRRFQLWGLGGMLVISAAYLYFALQLPLGTAQRPRTGLFPSLVGILMVLASSWALVEVVRGKWTPAEDEHAELASYGPGGAFWKIPAITAVLIAYVLVATRLGHVAGAFVVAVVSLRLLRKRPWWQIILLAAVLAYGSDLLFEDLLGLRLPRGSWSLSWPWM